MSDCNLSLVLHGKLDLRLEDRPIPEPRTGEVQIAIHAVGICGTDVAFWQKGGLGTELVHSPMVLGHEPSGVVTKLGHGVTSLKIGDRVAVEPWFPCRTCQYCRVGRYNLCISRNYLAIPPNNGALTRLFVHPADFCYRLPDHVSLEEGAMLQPLSIGIHACKRADVKLGSRVFICGAGPIGIMCMMAARARGAAKIIFTGNNTKRLEYVKSLGADYILPAGEPERTGKAIRHTLGALADVSIDCSGTEAGYTTCIYATADGGKVVLVGLGPRTMNLPIFHASSREVDIIGVITSVNDYPTALSLVSNGQINVRQLISHRFPLENAIEAFQAVLRREATKVIIQCNKE